MKSIRLKLSLLLAVLLLPFIAMVPVLAQNCNSSSSSTANAIECGANGAGGTNADANQSTNNINNTIGNIVSVMSIAVGVVAVIIIIAGGLRFITGAGNQESVASARRTITYAVIGLVIAAIAQVIVHFVLNKTRNATGSLFYHSIISILTEL